jgi:hypothetical protein
VPDRTATIILDSADAAVDIVNSSQRYADRRLKSHA